MSSRAARIWLGGSLLALVLCGPFAAGAGASPAWLFEGSEPEGVETVAGDAVLGSFTIPGLTTTCKKTHYEMAISNNLGKGKATFNSLAFTTCSTSSSACTVEVIGAEALPWAGKLIVGKGGGNYLVVEGVKISILYGGALCVLGETWVTIKGSAGALYDNPTETFTFSPASFTATGTKLSALGNPIEWKAAFTTEALEFHAGEALTIG
jgi:hypothetical protein